MTRTKEKCSPHRWVEGLVIPWEECHEGGGFFGLSSGSVPEGGEGCTCSECGQIWGTNDVNELVESAHRVGKEFEPGSNS